MLSVLLLSSALAATPSNRAATVLVCDPGTCAADRALAAELGLAGDLVPVDVLLELDAVGPEAPLPGERFARALAAAREAGAAGRWKEAGERASEARQALDAHPGTIAAEDLFLLNLVEAGALKDAGDPTWKRALNEAAAVIDRDRVQAFPFGEDLQHALTDARRELEASGRGILVLPALPSGGSWWVDGRPVAAGSQELLAGTHRVTALTPGAAETWVARVAVLPERSSTVSPELETALRSSHSGAWLLAQVVLAFDRLSAPAPVVDRLSDWCSRQGIDRLRLVRVVEAGAEAAPRVGLGPVPTTRPPAAGGEQRDYGEGVEGSWEAHLADQHAEQQARTRFSTPRAQVVVFDRVTGRFAAEVRTVEPIEPDRLHLGVVAGWASLLEQSHASVELGIGVDVGPVRAEGRLGVLRAPEPYNLSRRWQDRQLYRGFLGARWTPWEEACWGPYLGAGADLVVPVSAGGRAFAGLEVRPLKGWAMGLELGGAAGTQGLGAHAGATVGGSF